MPNGIHEREQHAHAKLTLYLHVVGRRADGYHLLDAEMVSLDLADVLTFDEGDYLTVVGASEQVVPSTGENLVQKALRQSGTTASVVLTKNIPTGGGLGGGSADAAAALRWAGSLDTAEAARLGADVPFCLAGGRAHVTGAGEVLEPLPYEKRTFTLITPPFGVNTAAVFQAFDALTPQETLRGSEVNHLEAAAELVEPRLVGWREKIGEITGQRPILAGSGATWFVEGSWPAPSKHLLEGAQWVVTSTTPPLPLYPG